MAPRRRKRWISGLACMTIIFFFAMRLPVTEPFRKQAAVTFHRCSLSVLRHPNVVRTMLDENNRYPEWFSQLTEFHDRALESIGELQRISFPMDPADVDRINETNFINWIPDGAHVVDFYKTDSGRSAVFVALVDRHYLKQWEEFAQAVERDEVQLVDE